MLIPCDFPEFWRIRFLKPLVMRVLLAPDTLKASDRQVLYFAVMHHATALTTPMRESGTTPYTISILRPVPA